MAEVGLRIDVWLWRARFFKTRTLAAAKVGEGRIRLRRARDVGRIDKPSRTVRPGDELTFAIAGHIIAVRVMGLGMRRGPPAEAQTLYAWLDSPPAIDNEAGGHR